MKKHKDISHPKPLTIRQKAEDFLKSRIKKTNAILSDGETEKLIHELEVHQIELEMQNEELQLAIDHSEVSTQKYTKLYNFSPSGLFKLTKLGEILELNIRGASMLGMERSLLINKRIGFFISQDTLPSFNNFLEALFKFGVQATEEVTISTNGNLPVYVHLTGIKTEASENCLITVTDITERKLISDTQKFLSQSGYPGSGEIFFESLARFLAQTLKMDYVCIDKLEGDGLTAKTVAIYNNGKFDPNLSYSLKETPCGDVVGKTICCFPRGVSRLFPNDAALQELEAESYVGTTLWGFDGKPIGLIAIIGRKPLLNTSIAEDILKLVSIRAAGELERNKSDEALRKSEEKYRLLFDSMTDGFAFHEILLDEKGTPCDYRFLSLNPAYEKLTGLTCKKTVGRKASEVIPISDISLIETYGNVALKGESAVFEYYLKKINRYFRVIAYSPRKGYFATIFEDITDIILIEKELQNTKSYLENLIKYANAPIVVWSPDTRIQLFNRAFEHLTGYTSLQVVGKKLEILFPKSLLKDSNGLIKDSLSKRWETMELPILTKEGEIKTVLWNSANIYDTDNKTVLSTIAQGNDITDRIKAEQKVKERTADLEIVNIRLNQELIEHDLAEAALRQSEVRLKELIATKDKFFNIVAHDLKNPFTSLLGSSELLYDNIDKMTPKNIKKLALILNDSAKGGFSILQNLLDWSRSQTGSLKISPEKINLRHLLKENISNFQLPATNKEVHFNYESLEDIDIITDKNMLNTVIRNLLSNALKFSYRHGTIIINAKIEKDGVVISIKDSGIGILQENIQKLFNIESRNSIPGTENELGTGLGLKLSKEFMEKLNGKIWVESAIDKGSVFSFSIPKSPPKSA